MPTSRSPNRIVTVRTISGHAVNAGNYVSGSRALAPQSATAIVLASAQPNTDPRRHYVPGKRR